MLSCELMLIPIDFAELSLPGNALQTRWIQSVQRWPITSLQTKATLLVIVIVAGVLSLSTLLNIRVSEHALERDPGTMPSLWHGNLRPVLARG